MGQRIVFDAKTGESRTETYSPPSIPLSVKKEHILTEMGVQVESYILSHYPLKKQRSDDKDVSGIGGALLELRPDLTMDQIYRETRRQAKRIFEGETLAVVLQDYPAEERFLWEQLIKAAVRTMFVMRCKEVYRQAVHSLDRAGSDTELNQTWTHFLEALSKVKLGGEFE